MGWNEMGWDERDGMGWDVMGRVCVYVSNMYSSTSQINNYQEIWPNLEFLL